MRVFAFVFVAVEGCLLVRVIEITGRVVRFRLRASPSDFAFGLRLRASPSGFAFRLRLRLRLRAHPKPRHDSKPTGGARDCSDRSCNKPRRHIIHHRGRNYNEISPCGVLERHETPPCGVLERFLLKNLLCFTSVVSNYNFPHRNCAGILRSVCFLYYANVFP